MQWVMVAPITFMLKNTNYYLSWLHFYGSPNATKSNTGIIILAVDDHHEDPEIFRKISNIDTVARLGIEVCHTTFPKLIDKANLTSNPDKSWLINNLKSAIDSKIVRSKFMRSRFLKCYSYPCNDSVNSNFKPASTTGGFCFYGKSNLQIFFKE